MIKTKLYLFTADFPYGTGETFLETEIIYLAKGFDEVKIFSQNMTSDQCRSIPENCSVDRIDLSVSRFGKIKALLGIFNSLFWQERKIIKKVYGKKITKGIVSTMLISLYRSKKVKSRVLLLNKGKQSEAKQFFYSYWCDDVALGLALAQFKLNDIRTLCRIHRWDVYFEESSIGYLPFRHKIAQNIGKIFSISQDGIDYAKDFWKTGLDYKFIKSRLGVINSVHPIIIERNYLLLVSCSNIIPVKRVYLIAEALKGFTDTAIKWVHFGDGSDKKQIETIISNLPANIRVELMGRLDNKEIYRFYKEKKPDLFVNVSSSEGVPVSIMEAMSFGIPVIATKVGGNSEIVNNVNGFILEANLTPQELANTIKHFIDLPLTQKELKQEASFKTWKNNYNAEENFSQFVKEIQDL
jgi:glycosyltransferase involved in cell wall biosynthesis